MEAFTTWLAVSCARAEGRIEYKDGSFTGDLDEWRRIASEMAPEHAGRAWPDWFAGGNPIRMNAPPEEVEVSTPSLDHMCC